MTRERREVADYCRDPAASLTYRPRRSLGELGSEAMATVEFARAWWKPSVDAEGRPVPGLETLGDRLPVRTLDEIVEVLDQVNAAQTRYLLAANVKLAVDQLARADFLEKELRVTLEWFLDDSVATREDAQLETMKAQPAMQSESIDAKAMSLSHMAAVARPLADKLHGLAGFDRSYIDEAQALSMALYMIPERGRRSRAAKEEMQRRNLLLSVLADRVRAVRGAARFVMRNHPDVLVHLTAGNERRRRAAQRLAKKLKEQAKET